MAMPKNPQRAYPGQSKSLSAESTLTCQKVFRISLRKRCALCATRSTIMTLISLFVPTPPPFGMKSCFWKWLNRSRRQGSMGDRQAHGLRLLTHGVTLEAQRYSCRETSPSSPALPTQASTVICRTMLLLGFGCVRTASSPLRSLAAGFAITNRFCRERSLASSTGPLPRLPVRECDVLTASTEVKIGSESFLRLRTSTSAR